MFVFLKTQIIKNIWRIVGIISIALIIYFIYSYIYSNGYKSGQQAVQIQWDAAKEAHRLEIAELERDYKIKEQLHRETNTEIMQELANVRREHESNIASLTGSYEYKLRLSEDRASIYQRQATNGEAQRRDLASHAARLDRAVTEGISLVGELTETLELRERQLKLLGQQILNDRKLLNE